MIHVSYTELRKNLAAIMDRANDDRDAILITRRGAEPVVMLAKSDYDAMNETTYLMSNPVNAADLKAGIAQAEAGQFVAHEPLG